MLTHALYLSAIWLLIASLLTLLLGTRIRHSSLRGSLLYLAVLVGAGDALALWLFARPWDVAVATVIVLLGGLRPHELLPSQIFEPLATPIISVPTLVPPASISTRNAPSATSVGPRTNTPAPRATVAAGIPTATTTPTTPPFTNTPVPAPTNTPVPTSTTAPTNTPRPLPTQVPPQPPTNTPSPLPTQVPPTNTPRPLPTQVPIPTQRL